MEANVEIEKKNQIKATSWVRAVEEPHWAASQCEATHRGFDINRSQPTWRIEIQRFFKSSQIHTLEIIQVRQHLLSSTTAIKLSSLQSFSLMALCCTVNQGSCWPTRLTDVISQFSSSGVEWPEFYSLSSQPTAASHCPPSLWSVELGLSEKMSIVETSVVLCIVTDTYSKKNVTLVQFQVRDFAVQKIFFLAWKRVRREHLLVRTLHAGWTWLSFRISFSRSKNVSVTNTSVGLSWWWWTGVWALGCTGRCGLGRGCSDYKLVCEDGKRGKGAQTIQQCSLLYIYITYILYYIHVTATNTWWSHVSNKVIKYVADNCKWPQMHDFKALNSTVVKYKGYLFMSL